MTYPIVLQKYSLSHFQPTLSLFFVYSNYEIRNTSHGFAENRAQKYTSTKLFAPQNMAFVDFIARELTSVWHLLV